MLPFIDLRLADYCRIAFNYCLGLAMPIGHTLWFDRESIVQSGRAAGFNLDEYLTGLLAALFFEQKVTSKILTCFAAIPQRVALSLCSSQPLAFIAAPETRKGLPGCLEVRHDFIPQTGAPFLLYEDRSVYRLHPVSQPDRTSFYVWDFCDYQGNFLKEVDKAFYFRVLNDKNTYYDYAVVPKNPVTSFQHHRKSITVKHVFCQVI